MRITFLSILLSCTFLLNAQDKTTLFKEAENFERALKEPEALAKYKEILTSDANNIKALVKVTELSIAIAGRLEKKGDKRIQYETALAFARRALLADSSSAESNYAMGIASGRITEVETDTKKTVAYVRDCKQYTDKALSINPNYAKAYFSLGRWHYEMYILSFVKKAAVKILYNGLPAAEIEEAIKNMEKCKSLDMYFVENYYYLNKAYKEYNKPAKQIEVLSKLVKLPTRSFDDIAMKANALKQLQELQ